MTIRKFASALLGLAVLFGSAAHAQKKDCYVVKLDGTKVKGHSITADENGNISLNVNGKMQMPFRYKQYRLAVIPKPRDVEQYERLFEAGRYADVVKNFPPMMKRYQFLGWSYTIIALKIQAHLKLGQVDEARKARRLAPRYPGLELNRLNDATIGIFIADRQFDKAEGILRKQIQRGDEQDAARAFMLRASIAEARNDKKEAVLEYLKVLLLFDDGKIGGIRKQAQDRAVALLTELKDPRRDKIANYK